MDSFHNTTGTARNSPNFVAVGEYMSPLEAHLAGSMLDAEGIHCMMTGEEVAGALSYYGVAVVKIELLVDLQYARDARRVLQTAIESRTRRPRDAQTELLWQCSQCEEFNARSFDVCWDCQAERPGNAVLVAPESNEIAFAASESSDVAGAEPENDSSPYRAPAIGGSVVRGIRHPDVERRAFRAAVLGIGFPVPLALYAFALCMNSYWLGQSSTRINLSFALSIIGVLEVVGVGAAFLCTG